MSWRRAELVRARRGQEGGESTCWSDSAGLGWRGPEKKLLEAPGSRSWLRDRKGLSGSAERTRVTATPPRSHLLRPGRPGIRKPRALRRKGRLLEETAQKQWDGPFESGALGDGAGAGSGRVPGSLPERLIAGTAARTSQVTRGGGVGARGDAVRVEGRGPRASLEASVTCC